MNVVAALALKTVMERENIPGTLILWPGVAEELVGSKAWFVRDGRFAEAEVEYRDKESFAIDVRFVVVDQAAFEASFAPTADGPGSSCTVIRSPQTRRAISQRWAWWVR